MPNPSGQSNLNFPVPYGDVQKRTQLLKSAPISGAPLSGSALAAPVQDQRRAVRPTRRPQAQQAQPAPVAPPTPTPQATVAQLWQLAAQVPGASAVVQQMAAQAAQGG